MLLGQTLGFSFYPTLWRSFHPSEHTENENSPQNPQKNPIYIQKMKNFNLAVRLYRLYNQG